MQYLLLRYAANKFCEHFPLARQNDALISIGLHDNLVSAYIYPHLSDYQERAGSFRPPNYRQSK